MNQVNFNTLHVLCFNTIKVSIAQCKKYSTVYTPLVPTTQKVRPGNLEQHGEQIPMSTLTSQ